jgi:hypothetical protein
MLAVTRFCHNVDSLWGFQIEYARVAARAQQIRAHPMFNSGLGRASGRAVSAKR